MQEQPPVNHIGSSDRTNFLDNVQGSLLKYCCVKDTKGSHPDLPKMGNEGTSYNNARTNGHKSVKPDLRVKVPQPLCLKNYSTGTEQCDVLHDQVQQNNFHETHCTEKVCQGSMWALPKGKDPPRSRQQVIEEAEAFFQQYFESIKRENSQAHKERLEQVMTELEETGTYEMKTAELVFASKTAWRNAQRCIMRIQWKKIQVFDCREVRTATGMFEALCNHIKYATNKGFIRSSITIFPQRTEEGHDFRIWNAQLISYAGYTMEDGTVLGDPSHVEFTNVCLKLGWKPKERTAWDILPLVVSADGKDPEYFEIPRDIIMEVHFEHPEYEWFKDLGLRWYVLPAIASMKLDCGGLEFCATAFNGWYMNTEIACRNFCDVQRFNITERVARLMGLDTSSNSTLWRDRAMLEVNVAVLHSFRRDRVAIVDHHTASEGFMKHLETEDKLRGGCPSDWVWIVPPMSASLTAVFHQEMALYYLKPSYEYQESPWLLHQWSKLNGAPAQRRKFHFKQIARAVKFTSKLFTRALSKRIKATILYGTETGKSETYAKELGAIMAHTFNVQVHCMSEYDMFSIEHETLLLIVTSTFGNGEPPANAVQFAEHLFQMVYNERKHHEDLSGDSIGSHKLPTPKSLMRTNSVMTPVFEFKRQLTRLASNKSSTAAASIEHLPPLSNVCYAVFALGSSAYPKFCNFGKTVDKILEDLGGDRIVDLACGDELLGQEQEFREWSSKVFHAACETFCVDDHESVKNATKSIETLPLAEDTVKFGKTTKVLSLKQALETRFKKNLVTATVNENKSLVKPGAHKNTIFVDLEFYEEVKYDVGDHVGIMGKNRKEIVDAVLHRCKDTHQIDKPMQLQVLEETLLPTGTVKSWVPHEKIPAATIRDLFTRFLDITSPPSTKVLKYLAKICTDESEAEKLKELLTDSTKLDDWRHHNNPHLAEVFAQFPSCKPQASLLAALLPPLQPRYYSISSSPHAYKQNIHLTVAVVEYKTNHGNGPKHYGVCSSYLEAVQPGDEVFLYVRREPSFHMPKDISAPIIMVGPGSGIAPFRGFWQERKYQLQNLTPNTRRPGEMWLFFGCRNENIDLYKEEKEKMLAQGVLTEAFVALSQQGTKKQHVQQLLEEKAAEITSMLLDKNAHFYVCGDCTMAEEVQQKLRQVIKQHAHMSDEEVDHVILDLMDDNRYHEDIFGITLRTAEVHNKSREFAKNRLASLQSSI